MCQMRNCEGNYVEIDTCRLSNGANMAKMQFNVEIMPGAVNKTQTLQNELWCMEGTLCKKHQIRCINMSTS